MYFENNPFRSYLIWFLLIFTVLILFGVSCHKNTEFQIQHISKADAKEEAGMGDSDSAKEDFTYPNNPSYAIWEKKNPPRITIEAMTDQQKKVLTLTYSVKNTTGEPICLFHYDTPFICLATEQRVAFMNMIPFASVWGSFMPHYPPIVRLETGQTLMGKASYALPLYNNHPYPFGCMNLFMPINKETLRAEVRQDVSDKRTDKKSIEETLRSLRGTAKIDVSREAVMYIGYFPEKDLKNGFRPGEKNLGFRRQFLAKSRTITIGVPVFLDAWMAELKSYWRK